MLAAHRAGVNTIILPKDNEKDLADIPKPVLDALDLHWGESMDEVLELALTKPLAGLLAGQDQVAVETQTADDRVTH